MTGNETGPAHRFGVNTRDFHRRDRLFEYGRVRAGCPMEVTMSDTGKRTDATPHTRLARDDRILIGVLVGVPLVVALLVFSNVAANHSPRPHDLPIGVVGPPAVADVARAQLGRVAPGGYRIQDYDSLATARSAIRDRSVYGAFQPAPTAVLLVATAASPAVAALLQRTFATISRTLDRPLIVQDVVPLPASDSTGATTFSAILGLVIAGLAGTSLVYTFTRHRGEAVRILATFVLAVSAGFLTAVVTNLVVAAYPGHFFGVWGVATLFLLAIGIPIAAFQVLFGVAGGAIGWVLFFVIGNPASGGSSAPELLPGFWRALSQALPPGAAVTSLRDVVYFDGHGSLHSMIVLAIWAIVGLAVATAVYRLRVHTKPADTSNGEVRVE
jgi:hypothetical protein